jgi:hypothetical protein
VLPSPSDACRPLKFTIPLFLWHSRHNTGMPYTPPSHQSPATSKAASPVMSRSPSFSAESTGTRSPASPRPNLPRSVSSTTYLNKQRRGPSVTQQEPAGLPQSPVDDDSTTVRHIEGVISNNGSIRQSPYPVNNLLIPTGAILSQTVKTPPKHRGDATVSPTPGVHWSKPYDPSNLSGKDLLQGTASPSLNPPPPSTHPQH